MDKKEIDKIFEHNCDDFLDNLYDGGIEPYLKYSSEKISLKEFKELSTKALNKSKTIDKNKTQLK